MRINKNKQNNDEGIFISKQNIVEYSERDSLVFINSGAHSSSSFIATKILSCVCGSLVIMFLANI